MVDSDSNDIYNSYIIKAITDTAINSKRPNEKAITDYVIRNIATYPSFIGELFLYCCKGKFRS